MERRKRKANMSAFYTAPEDDVFSHIGSSNASLEDEEDISADISIYSRNLEDDSAVERTADASNSGLMDSAEHQCEENAAEEEQMDVENTVEGGERIKDEEKEDDSYVVFDDSEDNAAHDNNVINDNHGERGNNGNADYEIVDDKLETVMHEAANKEDMQEEEQDAVKENKDGKQNTVKEECKKKKPKDDKDRRGKRLKKKIKAPRNVSGRNKVKGELDDAEFRTEQKPNEGDGGLTLVEKVVDTVTEESEGKGEEIPTKMLKKIRKNKRKNFVKEVSEKNSMEQEDAVDLTRQAKPSKKDKSVGMIFMCSSETKKDCYRYKVLGLPANMKEVVGKIRKGMRLFLYDINSKLMYGIYKAAGPGGYNIEPKAFNSKFPSQVRFTILKDCLPLAEEEFKKVIKDNYYTKVKFRCQLMSEQVQDLCKLFVAARKGSSARSSDRSCKKIALGCTSHDSSRVQVGEFQSAVNNKHLHQEYPPHHGRIPMLPLVRPSIQLPLPTLVPAVPHSQVVGLGMPAYRRDQMAVDRNSFRHLVLDTADAYRTSSLLERHDIYLQTRPLDLRNRYRQNVVNTEQRDLCSRDEYGRFPPLLPHRERVSSGDVVRLQDPLASHRGVSYGDVVRMHNPLDLFREHPRIHDPVYATVLHAEQGRSASVVRSTEYHSGVALLPEDNSTRRLYPY